MKIKLERFAMFFVIAMASCSDDAILDTTNNGRAFALITDVTTGAAGYTGTISTNANVAVSGDGGTWVDIGSPNGITIRLHGTDSTTVHGEVDAPSGTYSAVRVTLRNAQATVKSGSVIAGTPISSDVTLTLGGSDGMVIIEKSVPRTPTTNATRTIIVIDLNTEAWLTSQNLQDRVVEDAEIQQAAAISIRRETQ